MPAGVGSTIVTAGTTVIPSFEVYSTTPAHAASYSLTLTNSITFAPQQGQTTLTIAAPDVSQTLTVVNPCVDTTINPITFSPSAIAVNDGDDGPADFVIPTDAVDVANSLKGLCGARSYAIKDATNVAVTTWAVITNHASTEGSMTLTIKTSLYPN